MAVIDNLIAHWSLEESSGTRMDDHGNNDLTDNNTVTSAAGKVATGADFEASTSEWLSITDNTDLSAGNIDFSLAVWVKLEALTTGGLVSKSDDAGNNLEYYLQYSLGSERFRFWVASGPSLANITPVNANNLGIPATATWYFVVAWHDATANTINISVNDGTVDSAAYTFGSYDGGDDFRLGRYDGEYLDGMLDQVGFWKKVLTSGERTWLYNAGSGRSYADIVAEAGGGGGGSAPKLMLLGVGAVIAPAVWRWQRMREPT